MKFRLFVVTVFCLVSALSCEEGVPSSYRPVLPELPAQWKEIPGEAIWRLEWIDEEGNRRECELVKGRDDVNISLVREWTNPVLAWPFWPALGIHPGMMRPAGALFPWDVSGEDLTLSWRGGIEALFWQEMAESDQPSSAAAERLPWFFDWPRFRELLEDDSLPEAVRLDPWLADWKTIAQKTVRSGFDRRRIVSRDFTVFTVPGFTGRWSGSSPFSLPLEVPESGPLILNVTETPDTWVSPAGILKCSASGWVFRPSGLPRE